MDLNKKSCKLSQEFCGSHYLGHLVTHLFVFSVDEMEMILWEEEVRLGVPVSERSPTGSCAKAHRWQQQQQEAEIQLKEKREYTKRSAWKGNRILQRNDD